MSSVEHLKELIRMSSILQSILQQKLLEIQSELPPYVRIMKKNDTSFDNVLSTELTNTYGSSESVNTSDKYARLIDMVARKYNISSNIINEVIKAESNYNPDALSSKGAMGLMQLMPDTAKALGVKNPFDPSENIDGGVRYLKDMLNEFDGNLELALAAYNAGPNNVKKYGGIPPFSETQSYVAKIISGIKRKK